MTTYHVGDQVAYHPAVSTADVPVPEGTIGTVTDAFDEPESRWMVPLVLAAVGITDPEAWPLNVVFEDTVHPVDGTDEWALTTLDVVPA